MIQCHALSRCSGRFDNRCPPPSARRKRLLADDMRMHGQASQAIVGVTAWGCSDDDNVRSSAGKHLVEIVEDGYPKALGCTDSPVGVMSQASTTVAG